MTFLDRYGNEIGTRGIRHNDSIPLEQFPDALIKAVLATEDRRFYEHFSVDIGAQNKIPPPGCPSGGISQNRESPEG